MLDRLFYFPLAHSILLKVYGSKVSSQAFSHSSSHFRMFTQTSNHIGGLFSVITLYILTSITFSSSPSYAQKKTKKEQSTKSRISPIIPSHQLECMPTKKADSEQRGTQTSVKAHSSSTTNACLGFPPLPLSTQSTVSPSSLEKGTSKSMKSSTSSENSSSPRPLSSEGALNLLGQPLKQCCTSPLTGYRRDGFCHTHSLDRGLHIVCAQMTDEFLEFTKAQGNDLSSPAPQFGFPGLKSGDRWCLCAARWLEAERAGVAPPIDLEASHQKALRLAPLSLYKSYDLASSKRLTISSPPKVSR